MKTDANILSIGGNPIDFIPFKNASWLSTELMLHNRPQLLKIKTLQSAGIAPTRFKLRGKLFGRYSARRIGENHDWKNQTARHQWSLVRDFVFQEHLGDQDPFEETKETFYDISVKQGFDYYNDYRYENQLVSSIHHPKIPVHFLDGALYESDCDLKPRVDDDNGNDSADEGQPPIINTR